MLLADRRFLLIGAAAFAYFLSQGVLTPALPRYVADVKGGSSVAVGVVVGAFAITAGLLRPLIGRLGDQYGRRLLVIVGGLSAALSHVGYALAPTLPFLFAARLVSGVGAAAVFVGAATAAQDLVPDSRRAEAASYFSVAVYTGGGIGPVISEWVRKQHGWGWVWAVCIALPLVAALLAARMPREARRPAAAERAPLLHPAARGPMVVLFLALMGFYGFTAFVSLHMDDLGAGSVGGVFLLYSGIILTCRLAGAGLADRRGARQVATGGGVLIVVGLVVVAAWNSVLGVYVATAIMAPGVALQYPALMALCLRTAPPEDRSGVVASFSMAFDLSTGLGLPLVGLVVMVSDERGGFAFGAVLALVSLVVLRRTLDGVTLPPPAVRRSTT